MLAYRDEQGSIQSIYDDKTDATMYSFITKKKRKRANENRSESDGAKN